MHQNKWYRHLRKIAVLCIALLALSAAGCSGGARQPSGPISIRFARAGWRADGVLKRGEDKFLSGPEYVRQWGYRVDMLDAILYYKCK